MVFLRHAPLELVYFHSESCDSAENVLNEVSEVETPFSSKHRLQNCRNRKKKDRHKDGFTCEMKDDRRRKFLI